MSLQIKELLLDGGDGPFCGWFGSLEAMSCSQGASSGNPAMTNVSAIFAAIKRALKAEVRAQVAMA